MTNRKQSLATGQGHTDGRAHTPSVGVFLALLLLLSVFLSIAPLANAQEQNGISDPEPGAILSGAISIRGTATHADFLRYELAFNNGGGWLVFAEGDIPVVDGTLAIWDTSIGQPQNPVFPDGVYQLRLRVVRQDYNYDEYFVSNLMVSNAMTPTPTETATPAADVTRALGTPAPEASATSGFIIVRPTALPSLTPFPTPSAPVAAAGGVALSTPARPGTALPGSGDGLLQRVLAIETGRFGAAFWVGVRLTLVAFALLALYLLMRAVVRYGWRRLWSRQFREE